MPKKIRIPITRVFQAEIPMICLQTVGERTDEPSTNGAPWITEGSGGSVAKAKAAKVSMIKLTHKS